MPKINDDELYPITSLLTGATFLGSLPKNHPTNPGGTVQFSAENVAIFMAGDKAFLNFQEATKVGQHVMGNQVAAESSAPTINGGDPFFGTLNTYPATLDSHINFMVKIKSR